MAVLNVPKVSFKGAAADGFDPDSDDEDIGSPEGQAVLLGFADGKMNEEDGVKWEVSRLGGPAVSLPMTSAAPSPSDLSCRGCGEPLHLLSQIYCPLPDDSYDRLLHVLGCLDRQCQKQDSRRARLRAFRSWRFNEEYARLLQAENAVKVREEREHRKREAAERARQDFNPFASSASPFVAPDPHGLGSMLFGSTTEPIFPASSSSSIDVTGSLAPNETEDPRRERQDPSRLVDADPLASLPFLAGYYIDTAGEPASSPSTSSSSQPSLSLDLQATESSSRKAEAKLDSKKGKGKSTAQGSADAGWQGEKWEEQRLPGVDDTFLAFQARIERGGSSQVVRYRLDGFPLLLSNPAPSGSPPCPGCHAPRHFELQLMPAMISYLEAGIPTSERDTKGIEWATAWVDTCSTNCRRRSASNSAEADEGWVEEAVIVQWE